MREVSIEVVQGDITDLGFHVDVIVNAANKHLVGGAGVDGAIHSVCGRPLKKQCEEIIEIEGVLKEGQVVETYAWGLDANIILHAVGPKTNGVPTEEQEIQLKNCYKNAILYADSKGFKSIAFPNISTGVYKFPKDEAFRIAVSAVKEALEEDLEYVDTICFVCYDDDNYDIYVANMFSLFDFDDEEINCCGCGCNCGEDCECDCDCDEECGCGDCECGEEDYDYEEDYDCCCDDCECDEDDYEDDYEDDCDCCGCGCGCGYDDDDEDYNDIDIDKLFKGLEDDEEEEEGYCGFEFEDVYETPSERISNLVQDMVEHLENGTISKLEIEIERDEETDGLKVEFEFIVE